MLAGDYPCAAYIGIDRNRDVSCALCRAIASGVPVPAEDMVHLLTRCRGTADTRNLAVPELLNTLASHFPNNSILSSPNQTHLTQLILDPTSLNLPVTIRIDPAHPALTLVLTMCRNMCYAIHKDRIRKINSLRT